jgi:hypothetical protein
MALTSSFKVTANAALSSALDLGTVSAPFALTSSVALATGTGAGQADKVFADTRTLAASATEDLDLAGVLTDAFGAAITFARIKAVIITADADNTNSVQVTRPASNGVPLFMAAGDGIALRPGGVFAWVAGSADATGVAVTAGTGDLLTITNSAGSTGVDYSVMIVGASA